MAEVNDDLGLGLSQFVTNHEQPVEGGAPKQEVPASPTPEVKAEKSEEAPKETPSTEKKEQSETKAPPVRDEQGRFTKTEKKESKQEKPAVEPNKETAEKPKDQTVSPGIDWDSEENPHKKAASNWEKRFKDTERWGQEQRRLVAEQQRQLEIINRKLDGRWTEEDEQKEQAAKNPPVEIVQSHAEIKGRMQASKLAAVERYGAEKVEGWIGQFKQIFGDDQLVVHRVLSSEMPMFEAINAVRGYEFFQKYGNDPDQIIEKLRAEIIESETTRIREEETARITESLKKKDNLPTSLGNMRASKVPLKTGGQEDVDTPKPLDSLFNL